MQVAAGGGRGPEHAEGRAVCESCTACVFVDVWGAMPGCEAVPVSRELRVCSAHDAGGAAAAAGREQAANRVCVRSQNPTRPKGQLRCGGPAGYSAWSAPRRFRSVRAGGRPRVAVCTGQPEGRQRAPRATHTSLPYGTLYMLRYRPAISYDVSSRVRVGGCRVLVRATPAADVSKSSCLLQRRVCSHCTKSSTK